MARRRPPAGKRAEIIRKALLDYHGGRIWFVELTRTIATFRPRG